MGPVKLSYLEICGKRRALCKSLASQIYMAEYRERTPGPVLPANPTDEDQARHKRALELYGTKALPHILHSLLTSDEDRAECPPEAIAYDIRDLDAVNQAILEAYQGDPTIAAAAKAAAPRTNRKTK